LSTSDWCALQEALYKNIDTIQYNTIGVFFNIVSATGDDVLHFWQMNEPVSVYPTLSQAAQLYLKISASSMPLESTFA